MTKLSYADIGRRLQKARKDTGYTQEDIEEHLGINRVTISNIENGRCKIDSITLKKLADFYGYSVEYFLELEDEHEDLAIAFRNEARSEKEQTIINWVRKILFNYSALKEIYHEKVE
jgi:transcriptional regulator with XRE-family HTH domain